MSAPHPYVPAEVAPMEVSEKDLTTHHFVFGQTSSGMSSSHNRMWTRHFMTGSKSVVQVDLFDSSHDLVVDIDTSDLTVRDSVETHSLRGRKSPSYLDEDERCHAKAARRAGVVGALALGLMVLSILAGIWIGG